MSAAFNAIFHILHRVQVDPDFAWHMVGTESLSRCVTAYAFHVGTDEDKVREDLEAKIAALQKTKKTRIAELEEQIDLLEDSAEEHEQDQIDLVREGSRELRRAMLRLNAVDDLVNYCKLRNVQPSVAAIESAMRGNGLEKCLCELESVVA